MNRQQLRELITDSEQLLKVKEMTTIKRETTPFTGQQKVSFKPGASHRGLLVCRTPSEVCKLCKCLVKCLELFQHLSDSTRTKLKISEN